MACYHPITAYRSIQGRNSATGKWPIVFDPVKGYADMSLKVPCGQCIGCRLERSRQWAIRCVHEASLHTLNCFLTLTYDNEHLPGSGIDMETGEISSLPSLNKRDIVLFMKRLRKRYGAGIRFFQCGEYGDIGQRPHHHMIVFGYNFPDLKLWKRNNGVPLYTSAELSKLWPYGYSVVGNVTFESAAYVARYITKKINGSLASEHYRGRLPEYVTMSRRPGIGKDWFNLQNSDVYPGDHCYLRRNGKLLQVRPPKYYDKLYDLLNPEGFFKIKAKRVSMAKKSIDNTYDRLIVREEVQKFKFKRLIRPFESNL